MESIYKRWFGRGLLATAMACCLMLVLATGALASTVHVYDQAGVLNASQVQSAAQSLSDPMDIYTTNTFNGDSNSFIQQTQSHVTSSNLIVMAIDTVHHYLAIEGGSSVPLSNSQYQDAITAFKNNYNNGDYTGATIAAINSLGNALGSSSSSGGLPAPTSSGLGGIGFGTLCCIGLLILGALALFGVFLRRRRGVFPQPQPPMGGPYGQPYQQYPPNYGPGYNQGMNPWVAGGLGAAAGGLAGYELGRESAENQPQGSGNEGNFGGGAEGSFGNGGNIGGGAEGSFGNGGDFGGGAGGGFGGGGDFGGGGGGGGAGGSF